MSNSSFTPTVDVVFNLVSAVLDILALVVCLTFTCAIIYRLIGMKHHRRVIITDVPLILSINIICVILIKSTLQMTHVTVPTLMKDFHLISDFTLFQQTSLFRYRAYLLWSIIAVLFWSYTLLAFFSFVRVIYPTKFWLHQSALYLYGLLPGHYICILPANIPIRMT